MSPEEISVREKKASRKETHEIEEDGTTGMINILKKFKKIMFEMKNMYVYKCHKCNIVK